MISTRTDVLDFSHNRLPWFTEVTVLDGNHILRFRSAGNVGTLLFHAITGEVREKAEEAAVVQRD